MPNNNKFTPTADMFQAKDGSWRWKAGTVDELTGKERQGAHFVRGAPSPNPTGRPKVEKNHMKFIDRYMLPELERRLIEIMADPDIKHSDFLQAYKLLTERRFGKANQKTEHSFDGPPADFKPIVIQDTLLSDLIDKERSTQEEHERKRLDDDTDNG